MTLVRVWTDVGARKPIPLLAKIIEKNGDIYTIRYLSEKEGIWSYEDDSYDVDDDSIAEYIGDGADEESIGYRQIGENEFIKDNSDDDYFPSEEEEEESSDEEDEDEDEDEDESGDEEEVEDVEDDGDESEESLDEY